MTWTQKINRRGYDVVAAAERETLGSSDARRLAEAIQERRALVTFDVRDFSVLAKAAAVAGTEHWGIVLLSPARFSRSSIGGLVGALELLLSRNPDPESMKNRALFLDSE